MKTTDGTLRAVQMASIDCDRLASWGLKDAVGLKKLLWAQYEKKVATDFLQDMIALEVEEMDEALKGPEEPKPAVNTIPVTMVCSKCNDTQQWM